jgi:hypothetical protein
MFQWNEDNFASILEFILHLFSSHFAKTLNLQPGNTKGGSIAVPFTSCLTGLEWSVFKIKSKIVICHTADSKPVKQEVNGTVILPLLVFPAPTFFPFKLVSVKSKRSI